MARSLDIPKSESLEISKKRRCGTCKTIKPATAEYFYRHKSSKWGLANRCKECAKIIDKKRSRSKYLLKAYGMTLAQYKLLREQQNGKCCICNKKTKLYVDHCHTRNIVRGLICHYCNLAIGVIKDDPATALAMYHYLERNSNSLIHSNKPITFETIFDQWLQ